MNASQSDFGIFSDLAQNGAYIAKRQSLNASTTRLTKVLKTFIVSQALQANNVIITVAFDTNPYEVTRNLSASSSEIAQANSWHVSCHDEFGKMPYGVCDNWWYDDKDAYSLFNLGQRNENYHDLMMQMFQEEWTTGEDLFHGARLCDRYSGNVQDLYKIAPDREYLEHYLNVSENHPSSMTGFNGDLYINSTSLAAGCSSNVRTCFWRKHHDLRIKNGAELTSGDQRRSEVVDVEVKG